jgi:formate dehydrogenase subunit delta
MAARQIDHLVKMANQIALNLGAGYDDAAATRTAQHISRFWTPAMRRELIEYWRAGGAVEPVVAASLVALETTENTGSEAG